MALIIRSSAIHAAGCYTTEPIANGTRIIEYTGTRITKEEADERYQDAIVTYLFGVGDGSYVIDGHSVAMFLNHSCEPNCETDDSDGRVHIFAIRDIAAGEELVYDYNLYDGNDDPATCNCGTKACRKSMYSVDELKKRARAAKKAAAKKTFANTSGKKTLKKKVQVR
jgi:SET domain-containing protein